MTLYGTALFVHVLAAIGLVGTTAFAHAAIARARRAEDVDGLRSLVSLAHAVGRSANPLAVITVVAGIYMAFAGSWWGAGWPVVSLVLFAAAGTTAGVVVDPWLKGMDTRLADVPRGASVPVDVAADLGKPVPTVAVWVMSAIDAAIVALMTNKPGYAGALTVAAIAIVLGAVAGMRAARQEGATPAAAA